KELLLDLFGGPGQLLDEVVGGLQDAVEIALEDPILDLVAVSPADLEVLARHLERVVEPEHRRVLASIARHGGVLDRLREEGAVALPGGGGGPAVVSLPSEDGELHRLLRQDVPFERAAQALHCRREEDGEAERGGRRLVLEEDRPRRGKRLLQVRQETAE